MRVFPSTRFSISRDTGAEAIPFAALRSPSFRRAREGPAKQDRIHGHLEAEVERLRKPLFPQDLVLGDKITGLVKDILLQFLVGGIEPLVRNDFVGGLFHGLLQSLIDGRFSDLSHGLSLREGDLDIEGKKGKTRGVSRVSRPEQEQDAKGNGEEMPFAHETETARTLISLVRPG